MDEMRKYDDVAYLLERFREGQSPTIEILCASSTDWVITDYPILTRATVQGAPQGGRNETNEGKN